MGAIDDLGVREDPACARKGGHEWGEPLVYIF